MKELAPESERMPTVRGPAGVIADRSIPFHPQNPMPVYMLAKLRFPNEPHEKSAPDEEPEIEDTFVLYVSDRVGWLDLTPDLKGYYKQTHQTRFKVELWDAWPVEEWGNTGNPETDLSWDAGNPILSWDIPDKYGLAGARAAAERAAWLLAKGKVHPMSGFRSQAEIQHQRERMLKRYMPKVKRLEQTDKEAARALSEKANAAFQRWIHRKEKRIFGAIERDLLRAAKRGERQARARAKQGRHVYRALTRT